MRAAQVLALCAAAFALVMAPTGFYPAVAASPIAAAWEQELWHPAPGNPDGVASDYTIIVEKLLLPHPEAWGGAFVEGKALILNAVTYTVPEARRILDQLGVGPTVVVRRTAVSMRDLHDATARVANDPALRGNAISVGPQYSRSRVTVGFLNRSQQDLEELAAVGGATAVGYQASGQPRLTSRKYDTSPFYGGAYIGLTATNSSLLAMCSSGFAWDKGDGYSYMVTASHCAANPSGYFPIVNRFTTSGSWVPIGQIAWRSGGTGGTVSGRRGDLAVYIVQSGTTSARVYKGTDDTVNSLPIVGSTWLPENWQGTNLLTSGAGVINGNGDGEINPTWISKVDTTINYTDPTMQFTNLNVAESASECTSHGDSGGAYFLNYGTGASGVGIVSGAEGNGGFGLLNCKSSYTPLRYLAQDYGGTIKS